MRMFLFILFQQLRTNKFFSSRDWRKNFCCAEMYRTRIIIITITIQLNGILKSVANCLHMNFMYIIQLQIETYFQKRIHTTHRGGEREALDWIVLYGCAMSIFNEQAIESEPEERAWEQAMKWIYHAQCNTFFNQHKLHLYWFFSKLHRYSKTRRKNTKLAILYVRWALCEYHFDRMSDVVCVFAW